MKPSAHPFGEELFPRQWLFVNRSGIRSNDSRRGRVIGMIQDFIIDAENNGGIFWNGKAGIEIHHGTAFEQRRGCQE